jgi:hypothetical protein
MSFLLALDKQNALVKAVAQKIIPCGDKRRAARDAINSGHGTESKW